MQYTKIAVQKKGDIQILFHMKQIKTENNTNLQQLMLILNKNYELSYTYITTLTSLIKKLSNSYCFEMYL